MTVPVAFELRRHRGGHAATAVFIASRDVEALLNLCARLGLDPSGRVHDLAGGFLIKLDRPATGPVPGAIRLRSLARDFYLPVDAELVPALLDDESDGLVRDWGLVFLPGGRILRFDREARVDLDRLVEVRPRPRRTWSPLPEPRPLADRLVEIGREEPEVPPGEFYRELEEEIRRTGSRVEEARPGQGRTERAADGGCRRGAGE